MKLLRLPKVERCENPIAEAERFGKVEIGYKTLSSDREVKIDMGKWGKACAYVWGYGRTIDDACLDAVAKARMIAEWFPHPDDC